MLNWYSQHIFFRTFQDRQQASFKNFPRKFSGVTLILDGKAIPLRRFDNQLALTLYETPLTKAGYMCYKHKPARISMLFQVCTGSNVITTGFVSITI